MFTLGHFFRVETLFREGKDLPDSFRSLAFPSSHSPEYRLLALIQSRVSSVVGNRRCSFQKARTKGRMSCWLRTKASSDFITGN